MIKIIKDNNEEFIEPEKYLEQEHEKVSSYEDIEEFNHLVKVVRLFKDCNLEIIED